MSIQMFRLLVSGATMFTCIRPCITMRDFMRTKSIGGGGPETALITAIWLVAIVPTHVRVQIVLEVKRTGTA